MENLEDELYAMHSEKAKGNFSSENDEVSHNGVPAEKVHSVILNLSNELNDATSDNARHMQQSTCSMTTKVIDPISIKDDQYTFSMEKVFTDRTDDDSHALIAYQTSRPYFKFDSHKRRTAHGVV
ncbi:hypothetical protein OSTOST_21446 [Ostertagia ostertagi]